MARDRGKTDPKTVGYSSMWVFEHAKKIQNLLPAVQLKYSCTPAAHLLPSRPGVKDMRDSSLVNHHSSLLGNLQHVHPPSASEW